MTQAITYTLIGWGMSFCITAGNNDLSVGGLYILCMIDAALLSHSMGIWGIILGSMATAVVIGLIKVYLLKIIRMSSMVISIAYTLVLGALGTLVGAGKSLSISSEDAILGRAPYNFIVLIIMGLIMYYLHKYSVFGANCRAIGGNEKLAQDAGIDKIKTQGKAIMVASLYCGVAAILSLSYGTSCASQAGLESITNAFQAMLGFFIAQQALSRYINVVLGTYSGICAMMIISTGLVAVNFETSLQSSVTGFFLLTVMVIASFREAKQEQILQRQAKLAFKNSSNS